jgi:hypothetical protein
MPEDGYKPNDSHGNIQWGFIKDYTDPGDWADCGYVVVEPPSKFANLSYAEVRRPNFKISPSGSDPLENRPPRMKKNSK